MRMADEKYYNCDKPATHYSSTKLLFRKKIEFCETGRKEVYTLFVIDCSFRECVWQLKIRQKKLFEFFKKPPTPANACREKVFHKTLTNLTNHSLHTILVSHEFRSFVSFSSLFANSV